VVVKGLSLTTDTPAVVLVQPRQAVNQNMGWSDEYAVQVITTSKTEIQILVRRLDLNHDRMRPPCVRPGRSQCADRERPSAFYQVERRAWDSNPRGRCRPNGFQEHAWFTARRCCYLHCRYSGMACQARSSRIYPAYLAPGLGRYPGVNEPGS
jgi:hypothetical protein